MNLSTEIYLYTESSHSWNLPITEPTYGNLHVKCLYQVKSRYQRYNVTEIYTKSAHNPLNMVGVLVFEPCYWNTRTSCFNFFTRSKLLDVCLTLLIATYNTGMPSTHFLGIQCWRKNHKAIFLLLCYCTFL